MLLLGLNDFMLPKTSASKKSIIGTLFHIGPDLYTDAFINMSIQICYEYLIQL